MPLSESYSAGDPLPAVDVNAITEYINAMATRNSLAALTTPNSNVSASNILENAISATWLGSLNLGASKLAVAGATAKVRIGWKYRLEAGNMFFRAYLDSQLIAQCRTGTATPGVSKQGFMEVDLGVRVAGASGKVVPRGFYVMGHSGDSTSVAGAHGDAAGGNAIAELSIDLTGTKNLTFTCEFSSSNSNHSFIMDLGNVQITPSPSGL